MRHSNFPKITELVNTLAFEPRAVWLPRSHSHPLHVTALVGNFSSCYKTPGMGCMWWWGGVAVRKNRKAPLA